MHFIKLALISLTGNVNIQTMFRPIEIERHDKLLTLYGNHIGQEWKNLLAVVKELKLNTADLKLLKKVFALV